MNIFALHADPGRAAYDHLDDHIKKMPIEYSQLLAAAHRMVDGRPGVINHPRKGLIDYDYVLDDSEDHEPILPLLSHQNHPVAIWARQCTANYEWLYQLYLATGDEFQIRYRADNNKPPHASMRHAEFLQYFPEGVPYSTSMTPFAMAMPKHFQTDDPIFSYRLYYVFGKRPKLHVWNDRKPPRWFTKIANDTTLKTQYGKVR